MVTASLIICLTVPSLGFSLSMEYIRTANSVCNPSSRLINSLLKHNPGISPLFLSQNMEQKEPEKKIPSTAANAITLVPKDGVDDDSDDTEESERHNVVRFGRRFILERNGLDNQ